MEFAQTFFQDMHKKQQQTTSSFFKVTQTDHPNEGHFVSPLKGSRIKHPKGRSRTEEPGCWNSRHAHIFFGWFLLGVGLLHIGVSKNSGGPPKSSILIGFSIISHPFWGTPIFGDTHIGTSIFEFAVYCPSAGLKSCHRWCVACRRCWGSKLPFLPCVRG